MCVGAPYGFIVTRRVGMPLELSHGTASWCVSVCVPSVVLVVVPDSMVGVEWTRTQKSVTRSVRPRPPGPVQEKEEIQLWTTPTFLQRSPSKRPRVPSAGVWRTRQVQQQVEKRQSFPFLLHHRRLCQSFPFLLHHRRRCCLSLLHPQLRGCKSISSSNHIAMNARRASTSSTPFSLLWGPGPNQTWVRPDTAAFGR